MLSEDDKKKAFPTSPSRHLASYNSSISCNLGKENTLLTKQQCNAYLLLWETERIWNSLLPVSKLFNGLQRVLLANRHIDSHTLKNKVNYHQDGCMFFSVLVAAKDSSGMTVSLVPLWILTDKLIYWYDNRCYASGGRLNYCLYIPPKHWFKLLVRMSL